MNKALAFLKKELLEMIPPTIFFLVVFHVVVFARSMVDAQGAFSMTTSLAATVGALIVGKSILVADALPLFHWFRNRLIYNVAWRVLLYLCVILLFQVAEELIPLVSKYGGLAEAAEHFIGEVSWRRFWATHVVLAVFLCFYSVATAMIEVIGVDRFLEVFFGWKRERGA